MFSFFTFIRARVPYTASSFIRGRPAGYAAGYAPAVVAEQVENGGVRIHVREWPADGPSALLLHGLASSSRIWDLVGPRLAHAGVRTVAYDQRGHGRSGKPSSGYGFQHTAADAAAVIRALRLGRPVAVGHSWGANVVLELAVRRPRSVRGIVLVDGGFLPMRERFDWATAKREFAPPEIAGTPLEEFLGWIRSGPGRVIPLTPEIEGVFLSLMLVDASGRIRPRLSRANHLRILRAMWEQDVLKRLRRVTVPTLVLAARSTPGTSQEAGFLESKRLGSRAVRAIGQPVRFEWIDGIHDLPLQRPGALARRIVRAARS
jgi:pimeloyl-ACP methyl ester carboxylesterase